MSSSIVSVLMPTYGQAAFIRRALESLLAQTFQQWELIVVDDASPDDTQVILKPYLRDARIRVTRLEQNGGLGRALNIANGLARGRYLAYLPSDDLYYPRHLEHLATLLDARPELVLAYGGLRYGYKFSAPIPHLSEKTENLPARPAEQDGSRYPGVEHDKAEIWFPRLVQVMHRRAHTADLRWPERAAHESDRLEGMFWRELLAGGGLATYTGEVSCEWVDHHDQRHKIISANAGGLARYRRHYNVGHGAWVNWMPTHGIHLDERRRYERFVMPRELPAPGGLKILLVGELGFNPERIIAFEEQGHKLYGLWVPQPESWDTTGPLAYGNIEDIPLGPGWQERVRAAQPDVIYGLLNWQALELLGTVLDADLGVPLVFHFKEGPFICLEQGLWPQLVRVLRQSAGQIFINHEARDWFRLALGDIISDATSMVLDGDLPKADWFGDDWAPRLSAQDGAIHTVCPGRPLGLDPFTAIAEAGIHVHFYGRHFQRQFPTWTREGLATGYMHLHEAVEPADWVRELSQYDAAWLHLFSSDNGGDLRRARWDDLNLPARLGTYAAAGLPWIMRDNSGSTVALERIARDLDVGVAFTQFDDLAEKLRDRERMAQRSANMRAARRAFAFDNHVTELVDFFRRCIEG